MVEDMAFSHKIDYVTIVLEILNPEGHLNPSTGSKCMAYLLNGWIFPIGGASAGKGLRLLVLNVLRCLFYFFLYLWHH